MMPPQRDRTPTAPDKKKAARMNLLQALLLGALQGATEFLPISSSGHLKIGGALLGLQEPDLLFDIILHVGSLAAVCAVYWRDLANILQGLWRGLDALRLGGGLQAAFEPEGSRLAALVLLTTIPTAVVGLALEDLITDASVGMVGGLLLLNSLILLSSRLALRRAHDAAPRRTHLLSLWGLTPWTALLIGVAQGVAAFPGISRSGMTITACLLLAVPREHAARFSFLLSIPAILGALVLKLDPTLWQQADPDRLLRYGLGALTAAAVGYLSLRLLLRLLRQAHFHHFAWYCAAAGLLAIAWSLQQP
jgi:undecaprenyl-diphosphatase